MRIRVLLLAAAAGTLILCPTAEASAAKRCKRANPQLVASISEGLEPGVTLRNTKVVRSRDFKTAYFVAGDLQGPGGLDSDSDIAVWVTNSPVGFGLIHSVNAVAGEFSSWGPGGSTDARFSMSNNGASSAEACALK